MPPDPAPPSSANVARASDEARGAILSRLRERIFAYAASRHGRDRAEDLAQEVLVVLEEKYAHLDRMEDLVPLSFQILRFKLVAWRRRTYRRGEHLAADVTELPLPGDAPDAEALMARRELLERLGAGLASLGARCQELFRLKLQGRSFTEIKELMGAEALNTVYTWDHRCRKQLLERLGGRWA